MLRQLELVATMGRDAGFDSAGAYGDQGQTQDGELAGRNKVRRVLGSLYLFNIYNRLIYCIIKSHH